LLAVMSLTILVKKKASKREVDVLLSSIEKFFWLLVLHLISVLSPAMQGLGSVLSSGHAGFGASQT